MPRAAAYVLILRMLNSHRNKCVLVGLADNGFRDRRACLAAGTVSGSVTLDCSALNVDHCCNEHNEFPCCDGLAQRSCVPANGGAAAAVGNVPNAVLNKNKLSFLYSGTPVNVQFRRTYILSGHRYIKPGHVYLFHAPQYLRCVRPEFYGPVTYGSGFVYERSYFSNSY